MDRIGGFIYSQITLSISERQFANILIISILFFENVPAALGYAKFNELVSSDSPFAKHPFVVELKESLEETMAEELKADDAKSAIIGQRFLDLEEADTEGNMHKLSEYVGQGK